MEEKDNPIFHVQPQYLSTPPKMEFSCDLGDETFYRISMTNHYLSPKGHITKTQSLTSDYKRIALLLFSKYSVLFGYTWDNMHFASNSQGELKKSQLSFANGLKFSHFLTYPKKIVHDFDGAKYVDELDPIWHEIDGIDYSHLPSTPTINLLYMLTWDVVGLEEMATQVKRKIEEFTRTCDYLNIDSMNDAYTYLNFNGFTQDSFFYNDKFEAAFIGLSAWKGVTGALFEFKSVGKIEVNSSNPHSNAVSQEGTSHYFGKLLIDLKTGNLLRGDMMELITGMIMNKEKKWIPQQKRRFVLMELM